MRIVSVFFSEFVEGLGPAVAGPSWLSSSGPSSVAVIVVLVDLWASCPNGNDVCEGKRPNLEDCVAFLAFECGKGARAGDVPTSHTRLKFRGSIGMLALFEFETEVVIRN